MASIVFYIFAALALLSAGFIIFTKNVLYAAFSLVLTLLCIAAVYVFARAPFIAVVQIIVYIGGILVLMIFGLMLTNKLAGKALLTKHHFQFLGTATALMVFSMFYLGIRQTNMSALDWLGKGPLPVEGNVEQIGVQLMSTYILPFEVIALLLLAALVGALVLSQKKEVTE